MITPQLIMQGNLSIAPYNMVLWFVTSSTVPTTDASSGFPAQLDQLTIKMNSVVIQPGISILTILMQGTLLAGGTVTWTVYGQPDNLGLQAGANVGLIDINSIKALSVTT